MIDDFQEPPEPTDEELAAYRRMCHPLPVSSDRLDMSAFSESGELSRQTDLVIMVGSAEASRHELNTRLIQAQISRDLAIPASIYTWSSEAKPQPNSVKLILAWEKTMAVHLSKWRRFMTSVARQVINDLFSLPVNAAVLGQLTRCIVKRNDCIYRRQRVIQRGIRRYFHYDRQVRKWNARIAVIKAKYK